MSRRFKDDPKHWRVRAEEARANAGQMSDPNAKLKMLAIAENYERLAQQAEQRLRDANTE
jgi:hypothetical protein